MQDKIKYFIHPFSLLRSVLYIIFVFFYENLYLLTFGKSISEIHLLILSPDLGVDIFSQNDISKNKQ